MCSVGNEDLESVLVEWFCHRSVAVLVNGPLMKAKKANHFVAQVGIENI
jgi:hypothetical protein